MNAVLPVTIIGGFLGSGKTTLVNHLLRHANGVRLAVLVNDFGELPIDADLIEAQDGDVISLSGGCVCCSYGDDLTLSLQKLQAQAEPPDHIFIEASGVALPRAIGNTVSLSRAYQLEGIVVLADATTVVAAASKKYIGDTIERQLNDADLIVLNKLDLLSTEKAEAVRQWLSTNFPQAPQLNAVFSTIEPEVLFDERHALSGAAIGASSALNASSVSAGQDKVVQLAHSHATHDHNVTAVFSSIKLIVEEAVDAQTLAALLADKQCGLVRAKGFVLDHDNTLKTIQVVGRRWSVTQAPAGVSPGLVCIASSASLSEAKVRTFCNLGLEAIA